MTFLKKKSKISSIKINRQAYLREYYQLHKEEIKAHQKAYYLANKTKKLAYQKQYALKHPEKLKLQRREYRSKNRPYLSAVSKAMQRKLRRATPKWADRQAIVSFYAECPKGYEVDHIVPLNGKNVNGFHVLNNLRYCTREENRHKGNKWPWT